jgi:hypothetical protein
MKVVRTEEQTLRDGSALEKSTVQFWDAVNGSVAGSLGTLPAGR